MEEETICPYTGLRSFTEDESLYFKGRDEQIRKVIAQLEEKKFLMVTGASGDGKSSLIYAGLVPQARAGFFKAHYTNWYIADFRPERSPLQNFVKSLARHFQVESATIETELSRGFSSIVNLYQSSSLSFQENDASWKNADEEEREKIQRRAGNLLILVDQFEEFFTNPENFQHGVPSQESRLILNLLLETAKLSLQKNLPIYIVCTMRSDYIGQCAAFRGLPEFIGFSQFFVPRLKRKELEQVIEEPALLSGNKISKRLIQRLLFDLEEGVDQLPILQHALKRIWRTADRGREEMDLIHYAMVGGMVGSQLPESDRLRFEQWKENLAEYEQKYLVHASLANVLDIHANSLYEEAASYYNSRNPGSAISSKQAKLIIGLTFSCLTRIDEDRAVRNRMTLQEITQIIHVPELSTQVVKGVINIFREPEHTMVSPFISTEDSSLHPDTVLDITHESLIRNWKRLQQWASKEHQYFATLQDFKLQLSRWIEHNKSEDYLLPIGPLTYYENWFKDCRPNEFWLNRYNEQKETSSKLNDSVALMKNAKSFLRKSALNLIVSRTFMKYGARRLFAVFALLIIVVLSGFLINDARVKRNEYVLEKSLQEGISMMNSIEVDDQSKVFFLVDAERIHRGYFRNTIKSFQDKKEGLNVTLTVLEHLYARNKRSNPELKTIALNLADSMMLTTDVLQEINNAEFTNKNLNNLNNLIRHQSYSLYFRPDENLQNQLERSAQLNAKLILKLLKESKIDQAWDKKAIHNAVCNALNFGNLNDEQILKLVDALSPFHSAGVGPERFPKIFPAKETISVGFAGKISHNGGYQLLAYLYAAEGMVNQTMRCMDSLRKHNPKYNELWSNGIDVAGYFAKFNRKEELKKFVSAYSKLLEVQEHLFYKAMLTRSGIFEFKQVVKTLNNGNVNDHLQFFGFDQLGILYTLYAESIQQEGKSKDELNFLLALLYKQQGVYYSKQIRDKGLEVNPELVHDLFVKSLSYYNIVSKTYLDQPVEVTTATSLFDRTKRSIKRNQFYVYPDHFISYEPFDYGIESRFLGDAFFKFLIKENLIKEFYHNQQDYSLLTSWLDCYFENYKLVYIRSAANTQFMNYSFDEATTLLQLDSVLERVAYRNKIDDAWLKLKLIYNALEQGDTAVAAHHFKGLKFIEFTKSNSNENDPFNNLKIEVAKLFVDNGYDKQAIQLVSLFQNPQNKVIAFSGLALAALSKGFNDKADHYIDSALNRLNHIKIFVRQQSGNNQDFRIRLIQALLLRNQNQDRKLAGQLFADGFSDQKRETLIRMVESLTVNGNYYQAYTSIPSLVGGADRLYLIHFILYHHILYGSPEARSDEWSQWDNSYHGLLNFTFFNNDLYNPV